MKKIIVIALIFVSACKQKTKNQVEQIGKDVVQVSYSEPNKDETITTEDLKFMKEHGMTSSETFIKNIKLYDNEISKKYEEKYGLRFMSVESMKDFYTKKELIVGELKDYKYSIPSASLKEFRDNYNKLNQFKEFANFYFIRTDRETGGVFLQKIDDSIITDKSVIEGGPGLFHGQAPDAPPLKEDVLAEFCVKYSMPSHKIVVDHSIGLPIRILAQKEYFDLTGKEIRDNQIVPKDPAILAYVGEGWLILTTW